MHPQTPCVVASHGRAVILTGDGEIVGLPAGEATARLRHMKPPLLVHAPATYRRLGQRPAPALDLLELYAFVSPARAVTPTPRGLALALDLDPPATLEDAAAFLPDVARVLLGRLKAGRSLPLNGLAAGVAARMGRAGWLWASDVLEALGVPRGDPAAANSDGFKPWRRLPEWEEFAPLPAPSALAVAAGEARSRLSDLLGPGAEQRPGQADYAHAAATAFAPREAAGQPNLVLAEAGTGTGKTLGYIAPASLWAERNHGTVWISTFTKLLQKQIEGELARLHPDPVTRRAHVVVRKGRENYLCLLNLEDVLSNALNSGGFLPGGGIVPLGLLARWVLATADGDIMGGDLPGWFAELFGGGLAASVADRRGECIHGACTHYRRCFVEHTTRRARGADLVVANHALVMAQAAWGGLEDDTVPTRYVFDEGHHLFEAADSAFSAELSGAEGAELRRWLLGSEDGKSRARGLKRRLDELVVGDATLEAPLDDFLQAARALPAPGWASRLVDEGPTLAGLPAGKTNPFEDFLRLARAQVLARIGADPRVEQTSMECDLYPQNPGLAEAAQPLERALGRMMTPLKMLIQRLAEKLEDAPEELDTTTRQRLEAALRGLRRRALDSLSAWQSMLAAVSLAGPEPGQRPTHVFFFRLDRREGADRDVAFCRHHLDPTIPFAGAVVAPAHGILITSATLRDGGPGELAEGDAEAEWEAAEARVGALHLAKPAFRASFGSPFDYAAQTRAFVVSDVGTDLGQLAGAYRALFLAAGGGGLGLFTAISRLRGVHSRIALDLDAAGIPLLAQHVDAMDNATLIDIFKTESDSCLLGTDAMRDGVDVPGRALRLVVFERVPWPRPDILHRERRVHLSGGDTAGYDDRMARLRLRQAFGRLIRTATDRGVFVLLDRRTPTRLLSALPPGVDIRRVGLAEAVAETASFLAAGAPAH